MRIVPTRKLTRVLVALVLITLAAFLSGPRVTVSPKLPTIELPPCQCLGEYVKRQEEVFQDRLIPGAEKTIRFQHEDHRKTKFSLVYVHGFSASRQDCCPVPELVAEHLEANTFYARLAAHGLRDEDFANVSANDWLNDIHEAVEIGKQLGDRVVLMGHSTGGTLGLWSKH